MPGLGRTQQVLIMTLLWAVLLVVIDKNMNVHPERSKPLGTAMHPQIVFGLNHLCCSGCFDNVFKAVKQQSWLTNPALVADKPLQSQQEAQVVNPHASHNTYFGQVSADLDPTQAGIVDLMKIYRDIEAEGLALEKFELKHVHHFTLYILLPHLCCPTCKTAVGKIADTSPDSAIAAELKGLNMPRPPSFENDGLTLEFTGDTDIAKVLRALHQIGYVPKTMRMAILQ